MKSLRASISMMVVAALGLAAWPAVRASADETSAAPPALAVAPAAAPEAGTAPEPQALVPAAQPAAVRILGALSAPSVKNGETLRVTAVVAAPLPVTRVTADIGGLETVELALDSGTASAGAWVGSWTGRGLEEKEYTVVLRATDAAGRVHEDRSLTFTDPLLGRSQQGSFLYPLGPSSTLRLRTDSDGEVRTAVVSGDYAYFGLSNLYSASSRIVKVDLASLAPVGTLVLETPAPLTCSVVSGGHAYFGTSASPGQVLRVDLASFTLAGTLVLQPGEDDLRVAFVFEGAAYFGTGTRPGRVVKVDLATFTRTGNLVLDQPEGPLTSAVQHEGYAYLGTGTAPGRVVKVDLLGFTRVEALQLEFGEDFLAAAAVDGDHAYFGTNAGYDTGGFTYTGRVIKVDLRDFTRVGRLQLEAGETHLRQAFVRDGLAYFTSGPSYGAEAPVIVTIDLSTFSRGFGYVLQGHQQDSVSCVALAGEMAYFGLDGFPGGVEQVDLTDFAQVGSLRFEGPDQDLRSAVVYGNRAFFGSATAPAKIVAMDLATFQRLGALLLPPGEEPLTTAVASGPYGYFGTGTAPGKVVKVDLVNFARVGSLTLESGEDDLRAAVVRGGFAYFGTYTAPGKVVKVDLASFTRVGVLTLGAGEDRLIQAAAAGSQGYFGTGTSPGKVVLVDLDGFARVDVADFPLATEGMGPLFVAGDSAYFSTRGDYGNAKLVRFDVATFQPRARIDLDDQDYGALSATVVGNFAYLASGYGTVTKVALPSFSVVSSRQVAYYTPLHAAVAYGLNAYFVSGQSYEPPAILRIDAGDSQAGWIKATKAVLRESAAPKSVRFYAHVGGSRVRLALYAANGKLLWQSKVRSVNRANSVVSIPISEGTPRTLRPLRPGTYYLAWQVNNARPVPSYTQGAYGEGWRLPWTFGPFPANLNGRQTKTSETWTEFLVYDRAPR